MQDFHRAIIRIFAFVVKHALPTIERPRSLYLEKASDAISQVYKKEIKPCLSPFELREQTLMGARTI